MSAAVSAMQHAATSNPASRMGTSSPVDNKKSVIVKPEDSSRPSTSYSQTQSKLSSSTTTTTTVTDVASSGPSRQNSGSDTTSATNGPNPPKNELPPPPPPPPPSGHGPTPNDYFSMPRPSRLDQEPNPFEQSFAGGQGNNNRADAVATPKNLLPPVTAISSPAPLLPDYNWGPNSLRSGPLSPAMLQGPTNSSTALGFDHIRSGLTPNESGIRTGLTPGAGPMFPAPSPSAFYPGAGTPSTIEFQKTAMAARKPLIPPTSQDPKQDLSAHPATLMDQLNPHHHKPRQMSDQYADQHAANSLYILAQATGAPSNAFMSNPHLQSGMQPNNGPSAMDSSPNMAKRAVVNTAAVTTTTAPGSKFSGSTSASVARGVSEMSLDRSDSSQEPEPSSARKGRNAKSRGTPANTGKRKNDETSAGGKGTPNKKSKPAGRAMSMSDDGDDYGDDGQQNNSDSGKNKDTRKMTDEEKRKNFLERNRVAALKCRQRKKQWLANLQAKVEMYGSENDALNAQVQQLREEIVGLKTLLLAHKDCPVARSNGVQLEIAAMAAGGHPDYGQHVGVGMMQAPYPTMMPQGVMQHQQQPDRRFS
ncbi:hypothetical protein EX30DRAFT_230439 [Ascodesmis nigricans]|uniref:BZIP domain-containing protein n=1 Tax=Ascodesmis nigricans TaxID=341454 RepID=A0A4S2MQD9_9PEZI|nr:hypothetical protein EX30DRAFT_230439 [Ascodesmis nigricans]